MSATIRTMDGFTLEDIVKAVVAVLQPAEHIQLELEPEERPLLEQLHFRKLLTKDEAAAYIGIHAKTLTSIMSNGDFYPLVRIGHNRGRVFVNREKLDQWINEQDGSRKAVGV